LPTTDRIALVANLESGTGEAEEVERRLRERGAKVTAFPPDRAGDAAGSGAERVVVAGGDGSIAPAACAAGRAGIPVAVIPVGTANDFARVAELPDEIDDGCRLALEGRRTRAVDLGWLGERPFVNVVSAGLAPAAARRAAGLKDRLGPLAYLAGAIRAGLRARPVRCTLACDGREAFAGEAWQVTVGCSGAFGAGSSVGGELDDGRLRAIAVPAGSRLALLWRAQGLRRGTIGEQGAVVAESCRTAELDVDPGTELNVDGEVVESGPESLRVEPGAFELVVG
jgi:diacylglycerol kinase family enzyme